LDLIISDPGVGRIFVVEEGDQVVGMVSFLFSVSTVLGARVATLEDFIVRDDRRGRGLGRHLMAEALTRVRAMGCRRLTLLTDFDNVGALKFYERQGFQRSTMVTLRKVLD